MIVTTLYPSDPTGKTTGGIDSFIRGLIQWAPPDVRYRLIGISTDLSRYKAGTWYECEVGGRAFDFMPLMAIDVSKRARTRIPLSLHYTARLKTLRHDFDTDLLELHRIEPLMGLPSWMASKPVSLFVHNDMRKLKQKAADVLWRVLPSAYFALERRLARSVSLFQAVSGEALAGLEERLPDCKSRMVFCPTWADSTTFFPSNENIRSECRSLLRKQLGVEEASRVLLFVGRLDSQKAPDLLIEAFKHLVSTHDDISLVLVGDGVMRESLVKQVAQNGLQSRVHFLGLLDRDKIANLMRGSDLFVMTSAYEGMPIALIEAIACGLPAVATPVGEIPRIIQSGINGALVPPASTATEIAERLMEVLKSVGAMDPKAIANTVSEFQPQTIVPEIVQRYRALLMR